MVQRRYHRRVQLPIAIVAVFVMLWGALWGSFLNVVVYRVPAGLSVVHPRSRCPQCGSPITWWQNIPVLSWALLGGRCHHCKTWISVRYPLVEAAAAVLALGVAWPWLPGLASGDVLPWQVAVGVLAEQCFVFALLAIALIDSDTFLVPDVLSLPLPLIGLGLAFAVGPLRGVTWQQSAAGALAGGGGLLAVQWLYAVLTRREGLGTGDVKLMAGIGAFLGVQALPAVLLASALLGLLFVGGWSLVGRGKLAEDRGLSSIRHLAMPFGPFLAVGAVQWLLLHRMASHALARWF